MTVLSCLALVSALALLPLFQSAHGASGSGEDALNILLIDDYAKEVVRGGNATYNWTIQNLYSTADLTVLFTASISGSGWTNNNASGTVVLPPDGLGSISVTVRAAPNAHDSLSNLSVQIGVYNQGFLVQRASLYAVTTCNGGPQLNDKVLGFMENPLPAPLDNDWGVFLIDVGLWALITVVVVFAFIPLLRRFASRTRIQVIDIAIKIIRTPLIVLVILYGTLQSMSVLDEYLPDGLRSILLRIYGILLALVGLYVAYRLFKDVVIHMAKEIAKRTQTHLDDMLVPVFEKIGLVVIALIGLGILLNYLQVDLTLFVAGGVVTSMVIAFAAQDTLSNFFSGLFILTDQPFKVDDVIILSDGDWAQVRKIGMRTTRLFRFSDASIVTVPNNKLVNEKIANFSNPSDPGRLMKTFNVGYGSDIATVKKIISEVINANPHIVKNEQLKPIIRFDAMSESSLDIFILVWLDSRDSRFDVTDYLNSEIYRRLGEAGIEIPFPQRTVHIHMENDSPPQDKAPPIDVERLAGSQGSRRGSKKKGDG
jgi:MscS family membrane protein